MNKKKTVKTEDSYEAVILNIAIAAVFVFLALFAFREAMALPGSSRWDLVGSRLIPEIFVGGFGIFSLIVLIQNAIKLLRMPQRGSLCWEDLWTKIFPIVVVFVALAAFFVLMQVIGFYVAAYIYLLLMHIYLAAGEVDRPHFLTPIFCLAITYGIFNLFLHMQLPRGMFF